MNWKALGQWVVARMKEPSTYIGLGALIAASGYALPPEIGNSLQWLGLGIGGALGAAISEKS